MTVNPSPIIYKKITLTLGEDEFTLELPVRDRNTGGAFDLTSFNDIKLFQKSTNFASDFPGGGIVVTRKSPFSDGILLWPITSGNIPTPAGQYYGKVDFSDGTEIVKSNRFDITVERSLSS